MPPKWGNIITEILFLKIMFPLCSHMHHLSWKLILFPRGKKCFWVFKNICLCLCRVAKCCLCMKKIKHSGKQMNILNVSPFLGPSESTSAQKLNKDLPKLNLVICDKSMSSLLLLPIVIVILTQFMPHLTGFWQWWRRYSTTSSGSVSTRHVN